MIIPDEFKFVKEGWIYITKSGYEYIYYNRNAINRRGKDKIRVWLKWYWNGKGVTMDDMEEITKHENYTEAFDKRLNEIRIERENVSFTLTFEEYDFSNNRSYLLDEVRYDSKGNVISWESNSEKNWMNIVPGSVGEIIFNVLKKKYNK